MRKLVATLCGTAIATAGALVAVATPAAAVDPPIVTRTFEYTGGPQSFTVPPGVTELTIDAYGAQGGLSTVAADHDDSDPVGAGRTPGGLGAHVHITVAAVPERDVAIDVGGKGGDGFALANANGSPPLATAVGGAGGLFDGGEGGAAFAIVNAASAAAAAGGGGGGGTVVQQCCAGGFDVFAGGGGGGGAQGVGANWFPATSFVINAGGAGGAGGRSGEDGHAGAGPSPGLGGGGAQRDESGGLHGAGGFVGGGDGRFGSGGGGAFLGQEYLPDGSSFATAGGGGGGGDRSGGGGGRTHIEDPSITNRGGSGGGGGGASSGSDSTGSAEATYETGARAGNGLVVISYVQPFPDPPQAVSATAGNEQATVSFSPPAYAGTTPITSYLAICGSPDGGPSNTGTSSPIVVSGLTNDVTVTCIVQAINEAGQSGHSPPSNSVTPTAPAALTVPGAPRNVSTIAGNTQATVKFAKPLSNGGSGILDYTATCGSRSRTGSGSPLIVTGLTNGTTVNCAVTARNAIGTGPASSPPVPVKPATVPGAPRNVGTTAGNTQAIVKFAKPLSNGGSGITSYTATCGSKSKSGSGSPLVVAGLANGITVNCTVKATNAVGAGPASSPPVPVKPHA